MAHGSASAGRERTHRASGENDSPGPAQISPPERPQLVRSKVHIPRLESMGRDRLDRLIGDEWPHGLTLVIAPAGSGKTTLLARWAVSARSSGSAVAWYRAESTDATASALLAYLQLAFDEALTAGGEPREGTGRPWRTVDEASAWVESRSSGRFLVVIDDLHTIAGTDAEAALERFAKLTSEHVRTVVGSRSVPSFNVSRWRLSGELQEINGNDLRFRSWEVERLFREHYGETLRGDELGRLARRTEGWAAGLQLYHLATRGKSPAERAHLLQELGGSSRLIREYLARNVLDELPEELGRFLVTTSPLRRLSGPLCDTFLGRPGSTAMLEELERHQVFTVSLDDGTYRYHEVLQSFLEQILTETLGEAAARAEFARAAELLESHGAPADALSAYGRADRWADVARVLGNGGERLRHDGRNDWIDEVAPAVIRNDPWLRLGNARRLRAEGHWSRAVEEFATAESAFGTADAAAICRTERLALAAFMDPTGRPPATWTGTLRSALRRDPLGRNPGVADAGGAASGDEPTDRLAYGLACLVAGQVRISRSILADVADDATVDPVIAAVATIGAGTAGALSGDERAAADIERGAAMAERGGQVWLSRLARVALLLARPDPAPQQIAELRTFRQVAALDGDGWGEVLSALVEGWALQGDPEEALPPLELAAAGARRLGGGALEAWARGLEALASARLGLPDAQGTALRAEGMARATGVSGARVAVYAALAECDPDRADEHRALVEAVSRETGLAPRWALPVPEVASIEELGDARGTAGGDRSVPVEITLLGGFTMSVAGRPLDLATLKPRPRAMLRFMALNAGKPVHREILETTFWPDADAATAARNVHVALSGLRRLLCPGARDCPLLVREGEAYRLVIPPGGRVDLLAVDEALAAARTARSRHDREAELDGYRQAVRLGGGDLLPEDGPADWVVYRRDEIRIEIAGAARAVAELILSDDPDGAADACAAGLRLDPHHDGLWRLLIAARERAGDQAAAVTARQGYERMLGRLGVMVEPRAEAPTTPVG